MNVKYIIDSACDIGREAFDDRIVSDAFHIEPIMYSYKGKCVPDDFGKSVPFDKFYDNLRAGGVSKTFQISIDRFLELFEKYTKEGKSVVYLGFTSGTTGTIVNAAAARGIFLEKHPGADITVIDTLCVSGGYAMLIWNVIDMIKAGKSKDEIIDWVMENRLNINHLFTVDDLSYLKRGGRVSAVSAHLDTVIDFKAVLHVDGQGRLMPYKKAKGRKQALIQMTETFAERVSDIENQQMLISHGDCIEAARAFGETLEKRFGTKPFKYTTIGAAVGSHSGPGTIALFFFGKNRDKYRLV